MGPSSRPPRPRHRRCPGSGGWNPPPPLGCPPPHPTAPAPGAARAAGPHPTAYGPTLLSRTGWRRGSGARCRVRSEGALGPYRVALRPRGPRSWRVHPDHPSRAHAQRPRWRATPGRSRHPRAVRGPPWRAFPAGPAPCRGRDRSDRKPTHPRSAKAHPPRARATLAARCETRSHGCPGETTSNTRTRSQSPAAAGGKGAVHSAAASSQAGKLTARVGAKPRLQAFVAVARFVPSSSPASRAHEARKHPLFDRRANTTGIAADLGRASDHSRSRPGAGPGPRACPAPGDAGGPDVTGGGVTRPPPSPARLGSEGCRSPEA